MLKSYSLFLILAIVILSACSGSKELSLSPVETRFLDSLAKPKPILYWNYPEYPIAVQTWDLLHQRVHVYLEPEKLEARIKTDIIVQSKPIVQQVLYLDSREIFPDSVWYLNQPQKLRYDTTQSRLRIYLPKKIESNDTVAIRLFYRVQNPKNGLHFVNPNLEYEDLPLQVWTQHQPDEIRYWLPTIDTPADKATLELWLNVPDSLQTIATGIVLEQKGLDNNRREDYWRLQQAQPVYLWGFVVGNFAVSSSRYRNIRLDFFSDKEFRNVHELMYANVTDMLEFMESYTGMSYPFQALRFVPIHEFESAGMENTGMITLFDGVQFDSVAAQDVDNQNLLMHEIAHHWYGNTVTVTDWSAVALQEGLATWFEIAYLRQQGNHLKADEDKWWKYYSIETTSTSYRRPIITKNYVEPSAMFDTYSYEKAALVFDYLRFLIGDEAFQSVLQVWLKTPANDVNLHRFQGIVEEHTGKSWDTFFKQWFLTAAHPTLEVEYFTDTESSTVRIRQIQVSLNEPVFELKISVSYHFGDSVRTDLLSITSADTSFSVNGILTDVRLNMNLIAPVSIKQTLNNHQLMHRIQDRTIDLATLVFSLEQIEPTQLDSTLKEHLFNLLTSHDSELVKSVTAELLATTYTAAERQRFADLLQSNESGRVRIYALYALSSEASAFADSVLKLQLAQEPSYFMQAELLKMGLQTFGESWLSVAADFVSKTSYQEIIKSAIAQGIEGIDGEKAFELAFYLASNNSKKMYVYDALLALSYMNDLTVNQEAEIATLFKSKAKQSDLSNRLLCLKYLYERDEHKAWVQDFLETLPKQEKAWIVKELTNTDLVVE